MRWNLPDGTEPAELQAELEEMARSGIAGAEIGQGGFPSPDLLAAILTRANELGISISISHGPVNSPPGFSVDDDDARKTLVVGRTTIDAGETFADAAPSPPPPERDDEGGRATLVAVSAYRCSAPACPESCVVDLVRSSVVDLATSVTGTNTEGVLGGSTTGHLTWTAPDDPAGAQWQIVAFWARGLEAEPDLLSLEGTTVLTEGMEAAFGDVAHLMRANQGDFFYDSHSRDRGSPTDSWTNNMRQQFQEERGYDLVPGLPALFPEDFSFDGALADRVRNDFYQTRTDIWLDNHVKPLQEWAHRTYGWQIRLQPYGENTPTVDEIQAAAVIDRPETENLWFGSAFRDAEVEVPYWGFSGSPLVVDDIVIVAAAGRLVAYDRVTGALRWLGPDGGSGYSSPHRVTIDGVAQVLLVSGKGVTGVAAADGRTLWEHE